MFICPRPPPFRDNVPKIEFLLLLKSSLIIIVIIIVIIILIIVVIIILILVVIIIVIICVRRGGCSLTHSERKFVKILFSFLSFSFLPLTLRKRSACAIGKWAPPSAHAYYHSFHSFELYGSHFGNYLALFCSFLVVSETWEFYIIH